MATAPGALREPLRGLGLQDLGRDRERKVGAIALVIGAVRAGQSERPGGRVARPASDGGERRLTELVRENCGAE
jgi:hypothetical protein